MKVRDGFSGQPKKITCCERCVYGTGLHEWWCPVGTRPLDLIDEFIEDLRQHRINLRKERAE